MLNRLSAIKKIIISQFSHKRSYFIWQKQRNGPPVPLNFTQRQWAH